MSNNLSISLLQFVWSTKSLTYRSNINWIIKFHLFSSDIAYNYHHTLLAEFLNPLQSYQMFISQLVRRIYLATPLRNLATRAPCSSKLFVGGNIS